MDSIMVSMMLFFLSPLLAYGSYSLGILVKEQLAVKMQHKIKMNIITRNHRKRCGFVKPEGPIIKMGEKSFDYDDSSGMVITEGSTPTVYYNEKTMKQIDMTAHPDAPMDPNHFSDLIIRAFNMGILSSQKEDNKLRTFIMIGMVASIISVLVGVVVILTMGGAISGIDSVVKSIAATVGAA